MSDGVSLFGIRHHGPGCARSLRQALESLRPDCLLVEGPAGCEALLAHLADSGLQPPVALLTHAVEDPQLAVFHPYAVFSPEWQALQWAAQAGVPTRFMDVPPAWTLAWQQQERDPNHGGHAIDAGTDDTESPPASSGEGDGTNIPADPLDWLAEAAGYGDGETWWNHMVEERGDGEGLFDAIAQAMAEVRRHAPQRTERRQAQEDIREAHMRIVLRETRRQYQRIAVVCGAWHVPALGEEALARHSTASDNRLLKASQRLKTQTTWVPWTYRHLGSSSGYGAGVQAPGWYEYLWHNGGGHAQRAVGWYARVARLLREHGLDCSSAHLIEAARCADALAALRDRPAPGLDEIGEATRSVICNGDEAPMRLIEDSLLVGDAIGSVPPSVPTVPLQRDLETEQRRLRLKAEALQKPLDLDLRNDTDLQRSQLLHRLLLLDIPWGTLSRTGRSARGTFHEIWTLAWQPRFQIDLIVASRHGQTLLAAASRRAIEQATEATKLAPLAALVDRVLLANLPDAVPRVARQLEAQAAIDSDPLALLSALPALANVYRYGNVRQTDGAQVAHLFDGMVLRACIGLPLALRELDGDPAEKARETILAADRAIDLRQGEEQTQAWRQALRTAALSEAGTPLLRGLCTRLLLDAAVLPMEDVAQQLQLNLSPGVEPLVSAQWLDGFLNRNAAVLLHGDEAWGLIDSWLSGLGDEHFLHIVPLVRRTFAQFEPADRRDLGERIRRPDAPARAAGPAIHWDQERAQRALPMLRELLGIEA